MRRLIELNIGNILLFTDLLAVRKNLNVVLKLDQSHLIYISNRL